MSPELIVSTVAISLALLFYTWGVFGERRHGSLNLKYILLFWAGLVCDTTGTLIMSSIASQSNITGFGIHGLTGALAIVLMIVHALWATLTYLRGSQQARRRFHTFSTVVWLLWLVPYIIGMLVGIPAIHLKAVCAIGTAIVVVGLLAVYLFARDRNDDRPRPRGHGHGPAASR
ncbi:HsmA family protein [Adlercreutzia muris]|jgi:uncharacterized repeat protein (TIGR03987 family)|uniref:HsmA family protein n=1 Tax=Adlercreutzia muris TaxID=1796610 RepID=UPI001365E903|nr:HsmA family protein [Adlercreutzia muris]MCI8306377.1 TIGR03987 family protein [Enterorhabdus sp.]NCA31678.1 TIGR03987 family protein [Adlercreutzia muris]